MLVTPLRCLLRSVQEGIWCASSAHEPQTTPIHGTAGGALYLSDTCQQMSAGDTFSGNSAQQGGAVAILNPALDSGRYILSAVSTGGAASILRLPCGVGSALANATFRDNQAQLSGGAVYVVSTPSVSSLCLPSACRAWHHVLVTCACMCMPCFMHIFSLLVKFVQNTFTWM